MVEVGQGCQGRTWRLKKDEDSQEEREWSTGMRTVEGTMTLGKGKDTWDGQTVVELDEDGWGDKDDGEGEGH